MNTSISRTLSGLAAALLASATALAQSGGGFNISLSTIGGGGGPSSGGSFSLKGGISQPDANTPLSGGGFTVTGGFWAGVPEAVPRLSIRLAGANTVILSWPNPSAGFVLEEAANLNTPGGWTDVRQTPVVNGANQEVTLQVTSQLRFFRLRQ